ncbi:MAG TPA: ABC transporter permease [Chloroflexia bacterium]
MATVLHSETHLAPAYSSQAAQFWNNFRRHKTGVVSLVVLALVVLAVIVIPAISPFDPHWAYPIDRYAPAGTVNTLTGQVHWLGTDYLGRDELVRLSVGGRISLLVALLATLLVLVFGSLVGLAAGYYGGWVDVVLMRLTDFMLALPLLPMYLFVMRALRQAADLRPLWINDETNATLTLVAVAGLFTLFSWMGLARLVRASVLSLRSQNFVEAARALGANNRRIIVRHLLPNCVAPIIVSATFTAGDFLILEAILAYFGYGVTDRPFPSWGNMLAPVQSLVFSLTNINPFEDIRGWLFLFPTLLILISVLCINYIGDALRSALDPHGDK